MKKGKVLSLDYGTRRIGIATGDFEHRIAFPREIIENKNAVARIVKFCDELDVKVIVVGLPLNMRDEHRENPVMKDLKKFINELKNALADNEGIDVEFLDERLSSFEARELIGDLEKRVDAHAAQIILQRYFDKL